MKHPASSPRKGVPLSKGTPRKPRPARRGSDGVGSSGPSLLECLGSEGVAAWDDDVRGENLQISSISGDADMCSAASPGAARRVPAAAGRLATSASLPSCWIADTGCGHDLLCQRQIAKHDQECRTRVPAPPPFSGVGGCMTANIKLPIKSLALQSEVDPFVLPATPDVLSVGRRRVLKVRAIPFTRRWLVIPRTSVSLARSPVLRPSAQ